MQTWCFPPSPVFKICFLFVEVSLLSLVRVGQLVFCASPHRGLSYLQWSKPPPARAVPRPQPCDDSAGAQGKNRSIAAAAGVLLLLGAGRGRIEVSAVESVKKWVCMLRPLAEWHAYRDDFFSTTEWLTLMVEPMNAWKVQHQDLVDSVNILPKVMVLRRDLQRWLLSGTERMSTYPPVTSIFMNLCRFRPECNKLFFALLPNFFYFFSRGCGGEGGGGETSRNLDQPDPTLLITVSNHYGRGD